MKSKLLQRFKKLEDSSFYNLKRLEARIVSDILFYCNNNDDYNVRFFNINIKKAKLLSAEYTITVSYKHYDNEFGIQFKYNVRSNLISEVKSTGDTTCNRLIAVFVDNVNSVQHDIKIDDFNFYDIAFYICEDWNEWFWDNCKTLIGKK